MHDLLTLAEIEARTLDVLSSQLGIPRGKLSLTDLLLEDLGLDSLEFVEVMMELEDVFSTQLPLDAANPFATTVLGRHPLRVSDLVELVYLHQGSDPRSERSGSSPNGSPVNFPHVPFTQLGGRWRESDERQQPMLERLQIATPVPQFRRRSDGMRCLLIPAAEVEIGCDDITAPTNERPVHTVSVDSFVIDAELVSTTAYCRFLNSIGEVDEKALRHWFILDDSDKRRHHTVVRYHDGTGWAPIPGSERLPMVLVSWYGANAYALWANNREWRSFAEDPGEFLPSEVQWEYAARGSRSQRYPWGDDTPAPDQLNCNHRASVMAGTTESLPLCAVNSVAGMSPFGLHHMAGNVWQWCRDWYAPDYYHRPEALSRNPVNRIATAWKSERGGSWVGPEELCRSSYRRGRPPGARGRCQGFRCVSTTTDVE